MENILTWLQNSAYGEAARNYAWLFPSLETIHFLGLCILLGALLMLELRLVGIAPKIPAAPSLKFIPIAILYLNERPSWNYLWAGLCLLGAVYFVFRSPRPSREAAPQVTALGTEVSDSRVETPTAMSGSNPPTRSDHGPPL